MYSTCLVFRSINRKHQIKYSLFQAFTVFWMLYALFWVILRRLNFIYRRFGTLCLFHLHRLVGMKNNCGWEFWGISTGKVWLKLEVEPEISCRNTPKFSTTVILHNYQPMKMEQTECSETSVYKIQTPGNYPEESRQQITL